MVYYTLNTQCFLPNVTTWDPVQEEQTATLEECANEKLHAELPTDSQCHRHAQRIEFGHLGDKEKEG